MPEARPQDLNREPTPATAQLSGQRPGLQLPALVAFLLLVYFAAAIGGLGSAGAGDFYQQLQRPDWAPPGWLFGPVWSALYTLMGIAAWLVWRSAPWSQTRPALLLFGAQLIINALWSWLFFAWQLGALALADIVLLMVVLALTLVHFYRIKPLAAWLLLPYYAWVSFAAVLNLAVWRLNVGVL